MRRGRYGVVAVAALALGALIVASRCSDGDERTPNSEQSQEKAPPREDAGRRVARPPTSAAEVRDGAPSDTPNPGKPLVKTRWGGGDLFHLGRERPTEGNPMGPMSLATDKKGRLFVLDEVNNRIVRYGPDG